MSVLAALTPDALRSALLSTQRHHSLRLSPDGRRIAFVRTIDHGPELWVHESDGAQRCLVVHPGETLSDLRWSPDSAVLLYRHAEHGREAWRLAGVRMPEGSPVQVAHDAPVTEYWLPTDWHTRAVVYAARIGQPGRAELFRVDLDSPAAVPVRLAANPGFHRLLIDGLLRPRGGIRLTADGSADVLLGDDLAGARPVLRLDPDALADFAALRFSRDGSRLFLITSAGADTRRLVALSADGTLTTVFAHPELDLESYPVAPDGVWFDPVTGEPDLCAVMDQRLRYHVVTGVAGPPAGARAHLLGTPEHSRVVVDRSADDRTWLVAEVHDRGPLRYARVDPGTGTDEPVMVNRPELVGTELPALDDFCFTAGDGLPITGYAMRPPHGAAPYPTVVLVHGGPAGRDSWRFHAEAHYLATLGYLSLHVNYRGSRGFGAAFRHAGDGEWGGRMQQDLYDALTHGVDGSLVDPRRVVFMGASYGGYASLLAACARPDLARGAIAISPPCDLVAFATAPPRYWQPLAGSLLRQIRRRPDGRVVEAEELAARSPAHVVSSSCAPLLIAHGRRDPRVPVADVDTFVERATTLGVPVRYLCFADEGHHVKANHNRATLFGEIRSFLEAIRDGDR